MKRSAVRLVQSELRRLGLYQGEIDGNRGEHTDGAVLRALEARSQALPEGWRNWTNRRRCIALLQLICRDDGLEVGPIDGWLGPQTEFASDVLEAKRRTGAVPPPWRDEQPNGANSRGFPDQSAAALAAFYGPHGVPDGARPPMRKVPCPWPLKLAWNQNQTRSYVWCHEKAADSLGEILEKIHAHYGAELRPLGLDLFGGDYMPRKMRGGSAWSMHSWGIAIDWDPERNQLKWGRDRARLAGSDYSDWWKIWEEHGWCSLGRVRNYDWMHVQAARVV